MREIGLHHVNVSLITLATPMLHVDQSVSLMLIVQQPNSVAIFTALTLVLDYVEQMHIVKWQTIFLYVSVTKDILVIHL